MKNILITEDCFVKAELVEKGTILQNVDNGTAADLLSSGRAVISTAKVEQPAKKAAKKKSAKKAD